MSSKRKRNRRQLAVDVQQVKKVQGPQRPHNIPQVGRVELEADLTEKYLGRGIVGAGPYLEVLSNRRANQLICEHGYELFHKMLSDAEVDASLDALIQSASSRPVRAVSPLKIDDPKYKTSHELAEMVNWAFHIIGIDDWRREQLRQMLAFGHAVSEIDWDVPCTGPWSGHLLINRLRLQEPENYGFIVDRWGTVYGVAPLGLASGVFFPLGNLIPVGDNHIKLLEGAVPRFKLAIWTFEQRGTDPRGRSILIPAFIPWWSKQRAIEEWSCWLGRYAQPSLWATPGPDAVPLCITNPDGSQTIIQPTVALLQALQQFKSASVLSLPHGSEVNLLNAAPGGAAPFIDSINAFNKEITRAILGQHLATSEGDNQSRSAAEIHALVLRLLINGIRQTVATYIQNDIIKPMVEANYGDVGDMMPIVDLGDGDGFPPTVTEIAVLFQSGYFTEDQLPFLDKQLGFPVRTTNNRVGPGNLPPYGGVDALGITAAEHLRMDDKEYYKRYGRTRGIHNAGDSTVPTSKTKEESQP